MANRRSAEAGLEEGELRRLPIGRLRDRARAEGVARPEEMPRDRLVRAIEDEHRLGRRAPTHAIGSRRPPDPPGGDDRSSWPGPSS